MVFLKKYFGIFVVLLLSFWAIKPLFIPGFFPMHDDTQVARVFEMGKALRDGMFPVRWVADLGYGYGYPIFNFYAPLAYYFGGLLTLFGLDALVATKAMFVFGILLSGVFMYFLAREFWGEAGGIVSGLFYVYAPYHAVDIYVRGDVGEFWAYAFIPLVFLGFYKVFCSSPSRSRFGMHQTVRPFATPRRWCQDSFEVDIRNVGKWIMVGSVGYAGVILSHNLTAMMVTPFLFIVILLNCYIAYKNKNIHTTYYLILTTVLGLVLSAFYWVPALLEFKYTNVLSQVGGGADFRDHFVCLSQLWNSAWGFGGSVPGCIDGISFKIGKYHLLLSLGAAALIILKVSILKERYFNTVPYLSKQAQVFAIFWSMIGFLVSIFLMLEASKPIWNGISFMALFQYPWRFLLLASFFSSLLLGATIWFFSLFISASTSKESRSLPRHLRGVAKRLLEGGVRTPSRWIPTGGSVILIFLLIFFNARLFQPQTFVLKIANEYTSEEQIKWVTSKISDEYMPRTFSKPKSLNEIAVHKISILEGEPKITILSERTGSIRFLTDGENESKLKLNIAYFPAWDVFLDNERISYSITSSGLGILVPKGRHEGSIKFTETLIEKIANTVSLIGLLALFAGIILRRKMRYG